MPAAKEADYYTDMPVGEILKQAREHYGQSLHQVEAALRIRAQQLDAIERGDMDSLPGKAYAIGFVRSYAEYLGFESDKIVKLLKKQSLRGQTDPQLSFPVAASESQLPSWLVVLGAVVLAVMFFVLWSWSAQENRSAVEEIPEIEVSEATPRSYERAIGPALPDNLRKEREQRANAIRQTGVLLNVTQNSWVEIRGADGKALVSRVLKAGEQYVVPSRADLKMSLGNAGGVEISVGGVQLPKLGKRGEVVRNLSLDAKTLKSLAERAR